MIKVTTTIGYGSPKKASTAGVHGAALGGDEVDATRKNLGWNYEPFVVPQDAYDHFKKAGEKGADLEAQWNETLATYKSKYPTEAKEFETITSGKLPENWADCLPTYTPEDKALASRKHSEICLNAISEVLPQLVGGSADLTHSNLTQLKISGDFQKGAYENRNIHFGVREHAMGAICNGIALHNTGLIPYGATFLVFTDYMRNSIRLSALSEAQAIWVMTHDSIALGEDGPTHQPVEHVASLRLIPDLMVFRPADGNETSGAYKVAIETKKTPSLMALTRQGLPNLAGSSIEGVAKGGYVVACGFPPEELDLILIGTGSEVSLCVDAAEKLKSEGLKVRVVSMPCVELFDKQSDEYKESVLPKAIRKRISVEAGTTFGWERFVGDEGLCIGVNTYGASAPGGVVMEKFGFTVDNVVAKAKSILG